jgi:DNA-binding MarR family transcriptional regulator
MNELRTELRQNRPFHSLEQEALLSVQRTAAMLGHRFGEMLRPYGITPTQYNVLRILRGAGEGLCRFEIQDRLVTPVPDVTRLLDRLEKGGLIARERGTVDRRKVRTSITPAGLELLERLEDPVRQNESEQLADVAADEMRVLIDVLARVRRKG